MASVPPGGRCKACRRRCAGGRQCARGPLLMVRVLPAIPVAELSWPTGRPGDAQRAARHGAGGRQRGSGHGAGCCERCAGLRPRRLRPSKAVALLAEAMEPFSRRGAVVRQLQATLSGVLFVVSELQRSDAASAATCPSGWPGLLPWQNHDCRPA